jgi:hypothetical protein
MRKVLEIIRLLHAKRTTYHRCVEALPRGVLYARRGGGRKWVLGEIAGL